MLQKYAMQWGSVWHKKSLKIKGFLQKNMAYGPQNMTYEPPTLLVPYEPFLLGVGVVVERSQDISSD